MILERFYIVILLDKELLVIIVILCSDFRVILYSDFLVIPYSDSDMIIVILYNDYAQF